MSLTSSEQQTLNRYASYLRDIADKDYISARHVYSLGLMENFLWLSLQAVEKYLKAILLFNHIPANSFSHETTAIYKKIVCKTDIDFDLDEGEKKLMDRLEEGADRYYLQEKFVDFYDLLILDRLIWKIRRYCQSLNLDAKRKSIHSKTVENIQRTQAHINPQKFHIQGGYLEQILRSPLDEHKRQAHALSYKNPQYGIRRKKKLKNYRNFLSVSIPPHPNEPEKLELLRKYIRGIPKKETAAKRQDG